MQILAITTRQRDNFRDAPLVSMDSVLLCGEQ